MYQPDFPPVPFFRSGLYPVVDKGTVDRTSVDAGVRTSSYASKIGAMRWKPMSWRHCAGPPL